MEEMIETIRLAVAQDANAESRAAGAHACREILRSLETDAPPEPVPTAPSASALAQVAHLVTALRGMPMEEVLDLAIAKLRTMVPAASPAPAAAVRFTLVPIAHGAASSGVAS